MLRAALWVSAVVAVGLVIFFTVLPGVAESRINRVRRHADYAIPSAVAELHDSLFVADLHADTLLWKRSPLKRSRRGHVDLPRLQDGGVALQVFSSVTRMPASPGDERSDLIALVAMGQLQPPSTWLSLHSRAAFHADRLRRADARSDALMLIASRADLARLIAARERGEDVVGGLLAIEGLHALDGDLANVEDLYDRGYRMMGLAHFFDNALGGSLHGNERGGLTPFGREVVAEMDRLGIIIDLAHSSPQAVEEVLELSSRPQIVSHTGLSGACDSERNISDELMTRIAAKGGLIGVGYWRAAVCDTSIEGIARAIVYAVRLVGAEHVALGSDFDGAIIAPLDVSELRALTAALDEAGLSDAEIAKVMGGNVRDFLLGNLPPE
jgi:microsomal dipeptidase-like Zn-dependent dipeptidase